MKYKSVRRSTADTHACDSEATDRLVQKAELSRLAVLLVRICIEELLHLDSDKDQWGCYRRAALLHTSSGLESLILQSHAVRWTSASRFIISARGALPASSGDLFISPGCEPSASLTSSTVPDTGAY